LAAIADADCSATPFRFSVNVAAVAAVFATAILVTIVVVADGTVYSVVLVVAAAVRARALDVVAINYYLPYSESIASTMAVSCAELLSCV
jgi:hypothetical protein